ncbi:uncharacterized protein TNCV_5050711 [Trichonephila clavipes]|nr:uncharacterized protein TNCV_5050711 [Trichonephila clavipes]
MKEGLIASSYECPKCNEQMGLNERKSVVLDGFEWRCRKKGVNTHDVCRSIRKNSWFSNRDVNEVNTGEIIVSDVPGTGVRTGDNFQSEPHKLWCFKNKEQKKKKLKDQSYWIKNKSPQYTKWETQVESTASDLLKQRETALKDRIPIELFEQFYSGEVYDLIVKETAICSRYAEDLGITLVKNDMPQNRFQKLKSYLHLVDNGTESQLTQDQTLKVKCACRAQ